ncbi:hypothetical protein [Candidatus Uabimicrobium sp. HlEnr_7]|uniref:hypothetical protein n=1 Tax=Candidatus Uabimicrobium helgolandensis TaxID=3095367 RepID=UPI00355870B9
MEKISQSLHNTLQVHSSENLTFFWKSLSQLIVFNEEVESLETIFSIIRKIASLLNRKYFNEQNAQKTLSDYVFSLTDKRELVVTWISYVKRNIHRWLPKLFTYVSHSFLPNTNNDLESFNLKLKKLYRKTTGRKNSHLFLLSAGVPLAFALSFDHATLPSSSFYVSSYSELTKLKHSLFQRQKKSIVHSIKTDLDEFLFRLEVMAFP